jgi:hypothetical protein
MPYAVCRMPKCLGPLEPYERKIDLRPLYGLNLCISDINYIDIEIVEASWQIHGCRPR